MLCVVEVLLVSCAVELQTDQSYRSFEYTSWVVSDCTGLDRISRRTSLISGTDLIVVRFLRCLCATAVCCQPKCKAKEPFLYAFRRRRSLIVVCIFHYSSSSLFLTLHGMAWWWPTKWVLPLLILYYWRTTMDYYYNICQEEMREDALISF